ncbi:metallophosphoesterase family protein [Streptomyces europaeiscabiei]|uniref:metallophosphoesterase family protein n=1 Tax=Streptomyces europaeiscabiei TaxID=146819 RepID=UPI0029B7A151|nr:exonuclease SbcCD subunit D [Streptomyces europaeiscabiei]MDX2530803.1 exonuclease SbcCD subunit D [Streptomyces europaeiscabiei]
MTGRVFHTSDWHLGRQIGRHHRRDDEFDAVLDEIVEIADDFAPDLIVHSGDLFDGSRPSLDDIRRAAQAMRRLGVIAPVVVVAGNHDTPYVLAFLEFVLNDMGTREGDQVRVRFATDARPDGLLVAEYPTKGGELTLRIGALPYLHPNRFTYDFADPALTTATYAERMRTVQADVYRRLTVGRGARDVLVFAAHLFVEGATPSYSERRISLSAEYAAAAVDLPDVAYGALGHIHKPQPVGRAGFPAYYAGSPLQMDFGESGDTKSVVLAEVGPGANPRIELVPLTSGRRLIRLEGTLEEIAQRAGRVEDAWVKAVVNVEASSAFLPETLARMLPEATIVDIEERRPGVAGRVLDREASTGELPDIKDLLRDYLPGRGTTGPALDRAMAAFAHLQAEPDPEDPAPCCEETLLTAAIAGRPLDSVDRSGLLADGTGSEAAR